MSILRLFRGRSCKSFGAPAKRARKAPRLWIISWDFGSAKGIASFEPAPGMSLAACDPRAMTSASIFKHTIPSCMERMEDSSLDAIMLDGVTRGTAPTRYR